MLPILTLVLLISVINCQLVDWQKMPGQLVQVAMARDGETGSRELWGVDGSGQVWTCKLPCDGATNMWHTVPSAEQMIYITANDNEVWATNRQFGIYRCVKPCTGTWEKVGGLLRTVSLGPDVVWGVNMDDRIYRATARPRGGISWDDYTPGPYKFQSVSVSKDGTVWAATRDNRLMRFKQIEKTWELMSGTGKQVAVSDDYILAVSPLNIVSRCKRPCKTNAWEVVGNNVVMVSGEWTEPGSLFAISSSNGVFEGKMRPPVPPMQQPSQQLQQNYAPQYVQDSQQQYSPNGANLLAELDQNPQNIY